MPVKITTPVINTTIKRKETKSEKSFSDILNSDIKLFGGNISSASKSNFYKSLHTLLSSGLDIRRSLQLIGEAEGKKSNLKNILVQLESDIIAGASLSDAVKKSGKFSDFEIYSIQIGEESGRLLAVFEELTSHYKKANEYRRQLIGAITYPSFVVSFAFLVVFLLLKYLVPMFTDVYGRMDGELPKVTQIIISVSDWLGNYSGYVFLGLLLIFVAAFTQKEKIWFRKCSSFILLKIPIFGKIIHKIYLARFAQSMNLLLSAKIPLLRAVELTEKMLTLYPLQKSLQATGELILKGKSLKAGLSQSNFFPNQFLALIQVGEESGKLDEMFKNLANQYKNEADENTAVIGSLLEPILIIGLGVIVGFILVAIYLPLFQMGAMSS